MRIKIIKCSDINPKGIEYWYKDRIGQEFDVESSTVNDFYYWVKYDNKTKMNVVNVNDVEIL